MTKFHDFLIDSEAEKLLGWNRQSAGLDTAVLEASESGELKRKIGEERESKDLIAFNSENDELAVKASEDPRIDIMIYRSEEKINHVIAKKASENSIQIGFSLKQLHDSQNKYSILKTWSDSIQILEKFDTQYLITTEAEKSSEIRPPRDLSALITELDGDGEKAISKNPLKLLKKVESREKDSFVRPGVEKE
jgi:RNase P/RNase MRP subunit p30